MKVFVTAGATLLPRGLQLENSIYIENYHSETKKSTSGFTENKIEENSYKLTCVDKTVGRISNRQSRWLLYSGIKSWDDSLIDKEIPPQQRGLFLGLGTSDSDDNIEPVGFSEIDKNSYVNTAIFGMQPTIGLTLLNTSCASQLAQHLNFWGDNCFYSPHCDAGTNALIEAFYSIYENKCKIALCGGASQKLSDWFYLSYEKDLRDVGCHNLTEASSCVFIHDDVNFAAAELAHVRRAVIYNQTQYQQFLKNYEHIAEEIDVVLHTGPGSKEYQRFSYADQYISNLKNIELDKHYGYSGAASVFLAINYAILHWNKNRSIEEIVHPSKINKILIINHGLQGQCAAMTLNFNTEE